MSLKMSKKCFSIEVNDIFDDLIEDNKRLVNELMFAINCLNELKTHLINIHSNYETIIGFEDKQEFNQLRDQLKTIEIIATNRRKVFEVSEELNGFAVNCRQNETEFQIDVKTVDKDIDFEAVLSTEDMNQVFDDSNEELNLKSNKSQRKDKKLKQISTKSNQNFDSNEGNNDLKAKRVKGKQCLDSKANKKSEKCLTITKRAKKGHKKCQLFCDFENCNNIKGFKRLQDLVNHKRLHLNEKRFHCPFNGCDYKSNIKPYLLKHQKCHSDDRPFVCDYEECDRSFKNKISFDYHLSTHNTNGRQKYDCPFSGCGKSFFTNSLLTRHTARHRSLPTLSCSWDGCEEKFFNDNEIRKHKALVHNKKRIWKLKPMVSCDWPGCEWRGRNMKMHKTIHTGEKQFLCDWPECGKRFRLKINLESHQNIHYNRKPYACHWPGCQYSSSYSSNVYKHIRLTHKNDK